MYIKVKDFADRAGLSRQKIYRMIDSGQIPDKFVRTTDNGKTIDEGALSFCCPSARTNSPDTDRQADMLAETLADTVKALQEQLQQKDKQISILSDMIKSRDEENKMLLGQLSNAQALHAGTLQKELLEAPPEDRTGQEADKKKKSFIARFLFKE